MRRILIENARRKRAVRHGGGLLRNDIDEIDIAAPAKDEELLAVSDALEKLAARDKPKAELVKLRYFVGFTRPKLDRRALGDEFALCSESFQLRNDPAPVAAIGVLEFEDLALHPGVDFFFDAWPLMRR